MARGDTARRTLILPGHVPPSGGLTILVPAGYERPPAFRCELCGKQFNKNEGAVWERHVGECARVHHDEIQALVAKRQSGPSHESNWDPEIAEHMLDLGKKMRREGRFEVRPNERMGF